MAAASQARVLRGGLADTAVPLRSDFSTAS